MSGPYTMKQPMNPNDIQSMQPTGAPSWGQGPYNPNPVQQQQPQPQQSKGGFGNILMNLMQGGMSGMGMGARMGGGGGNDLMSALAPLLGGGAMGGLGAILQMIRNHGNGAQQPQQPQQQQISQGPDQMSNYGYGG